jgi:hypothetical protein
MDWDDTGWRPLRDDDPLRDTWPGLRVLAEVGMVTTGPVEPRRHLVSDVWREIERLREVERLALAHLDALVADPIYQMTDESVERTAIALGRAVRKN